MQGRDGFFGVLVSPVGSESRETRPRTAATPPDLGDFNVGDGSKPAKVQLVALLKGPKTAHVDSTSPIWSAVRMAVHASDFGAASSAKQAPTRM